MGKNLNTLPENYIEPKNNLSGSLDGTNLTIGIVCATFNQFITKSLLMGSIECLTSKHVKETNIQTYFVPGAFEVPLIVNKIAPNVDAVIAIACVIQGDTPHFDYVCEGITTGINNAITTHKKPIIYCVLTTHTEEQALERCKPNCKSNKGYEAACAAIEMSNLIKSI